MSDKLYDVIVVGSGPAGYAAAIHATRSGLRVLVLQGFKAGGRLMLTGDVEGYPGIAEGVIGLDLSERMEQQVSEAGAELHPWDVVRVDLTRRPFRCWAEGEDEPAIARAVIVATGARPRWLGLEGELRLMGRGVSVCATCDGFFFKDRRVAVVGGGDWALQEALFLTRYASEVVLVHRRGRFRAVEALLRRVRDNPRITILTSAEVVEVLGEHSLEGVVVKGTRVHARRTLDVEGLFVAIGSEPHLGLFAGLLDTDEDGYVILKERTMTSVPGVFAAEEVADRRYRQTATAVGDGIRAAIDARAWLETRRGY